MPSHKHKKKKKSHKRSKRYSSSGSESASKLSPWSVPLTDADSDESSNQEQLTSLVRRTYMNYLKQALTINFKDCVGNSNECDLESIEELVQKWSSVLEQKAMRTCMVSELYRTSMVSIIKQIKEHTRGRKSFLEDKNLLRLKSKVPVSSSSQTDLEERREVDTQTDLRTPSLLDLPLPKSSPSHVPYDPAIEFSDSYSSDRGVSSSLGDNQGQPIPVVCGTTGNQEICNISSTSDLLDLVELPAVENKLKTVSPEHSLCQRNSVSQINSNFSSIICSNNQNLSSSNEMDSCPKKLITLKRQRNCVKSVEISKTNLDERLSALGLLVDKEDSCEPLGKLRKSNWFAEETAQSCNLTRILMRMTTSQRERVLRKIKELFGGDHGPLTELSEANMTVCRKRIASVVVTELTPVYQAKKIASRHLFKFLAKKITRSIMEKSLAPDAKSIRWRVKKYFEDGKIISSESDCI